MKKILIGLLVSVMFLGCDFDRTGPTIVVSDSMYCVEHGDIISLFVEINDADLSIVNMTAPDLDFIDQYSGEDFMNSNGEIEFIFVISLGTPRGNYVLGIEAIDDSDNVSTEVVEIKIE